uniref:Uncharacterized protein n=1 Tax=Molossus molossus TaxID=27622 RepID=A0A7J8BYI7_MOLMO|nr:hypothetical protein HJG59_010061 [Molossus molossus]
MSRHSGIQGVWDTAEKKMESAVSLGGSWRQRDTELSFRVCIFVCVCLWFLPRAILLPGDFGQCLETLLTVTTGGQVLVGRSQDASQPPAMQWTATPNDESSSPKSVEPRLRKECREHFCGLCPETPGLQRTGRNHSLHHPLSLPPPTGCFPADHQAPGLIESEQLRQM